MSRHANVESVQRHLLILHVLNNGPTLQQAMAVRTKVDQICLTWRSRRAAYASDSDDETTRESGRKLWQRDLRLLRDRGYLESRLSNPDSGQSEMLRAISMDKPRDCWLTAAEHRALGRARERQCDRDSSPPGTWGNAAELDLAFHLMRLIEERLDAVQIVEFCAELGITETQGRHLLDLLDVVFNAESARLNFVWPDADDDEDVEHAEDDSLIDPTGVGFMPPFRNFDIAPLDGVGMAELGRFAYSRWECIDRIRIINRALDDPATSPEDVALLESAKAKLDRWRSMLPEPHPAQGRRGCRSPKANAHP